MLIAQPLNPLDFVNSSRRYLTSAVYPNAVGTALIISAMCKILVISRQPICGRRSAGTAMRKNRVSPLR